MIVCRTYILEGKAAVHIFGEEDWSKESADAKAMILIQAVLDQVEYKDTFVFEDLFQVTSYSGDSEWGGVGLPDSSIVSASKYPWGKLE